MNNLRSKLSFFGAMALACSLAASLPPSPAEAGPFSKGSFGRHAAGVVAGAVTQEVVKEVAGDNSTETRTIAAVAGVAVAVGVSGDTSVGSIAGHALGQALIAGATSDWFDPRTNRRGRFHVVRTWRRPDPVYVRYYPSRVETVPPLELMGGPYAASKSINVRGGPSTKYAKVGTLHRGQVVNVVGKVEGRNWYLISEHGVGTGYVHSKLLRPVPGSPKPELSAEAQPALEAEPLATEEIVEQTIAEDRNCREIEMTTTGDDGAETKEVFTACESPEGWSVVDS